MAFDKAPMISGLGGESGDYSLISDRDRSEILNRIRNLRELEDYLFTEGYEQYYARDLFDYMNHSFLMLLDFEDKEVLDIGAGEGTLSVFFAKYGAKQVFALEQNTGRLNLLDRYSRHLGVRNKIKILQGDFTKVSIRESSFDIITMIGVLEWLAKKDPYREHMAYLKKIYDAMKPKGQFLLAIENRYNPGYFIGKTNHGDLPFAPVMPRFLAQAYTRAVKKERYLTYTYSDRVYRKMFKDTGFRDVKIYPVIFSYQEPRYVIASVSVYRKLLTKYGISRGINMGSKALSILPDMILRKLAPCYIIVGEKG